MIRRPSERETGTTWESWNTSLYNLFYCFACTANFVSRTKKVENCCCPQQVFFTELKANYEYKCDWQLRKTRDIRHLYNAVVVLKKIAIEEFQPTLKLQVHIKVQAEPLNLFSGKPVFNIKDFKFQQAIHQRRRRQLLVRGYPWVISFVGEFFDLSFSISRRHLACCPVLRAMN